MIFMKLFSQFIFFSCIFSCFANLCFAQQIEGYVKTKDGKPIIDVSVNDERSDAKGFFKTEISTFLKTDVKGVVLFTKEGFIPKAVAVELSAKNIEVVMDEDIPNERMKVATCGNLAGKKTVGGIYKVFVPKGAKKKSGFDIDYGYFYISFGKGKNKDLLDGMFYFSGSAKRPPNDEIINSKEIKVRVRENSSGILGSDWFGQTDDGNYWRYLGFDLDGGNKISYSVDSMEAANYFDRIIDNGCIKIPDWVKDAKAK